MGASDGYLDVQLHLVVGSTIGERLWIGDLPRLTMAYREDGLRQRLLEEGVVSQQGKACDLIVDGLDILQRGRVLLVTASGEPCASEQS